MNAQTHNKDGKMTDENGKKIVHRSEHPEMSGGQLIGYYYICECGYAEADYEADEHVYCPKCGGRYEDTVTSTTTIDEQAGDNMKQTNKQVNEQVNGMVFALLGGEMLEAMDWVLKNYPVESGLIGQKLGNITEFPNKAGKLAYVMNFLKIFDALMSTKVEEGEIIMEELEEARIHGSIHAFYFFRDALQGGDEWEDFFLPATLELENKYQLKKELKKELKKLGIKYDTDIGLCTFDIEDHMSIKEIKEIKEKGDKVIEEMTGQIPRHYDDSFLCLSFDFCL